MIVLETFHNGDILNRFVSMGRLLVVAVAFWAVTLAGTSQALPPAVPEIDPGSFGSVMALVMGSLALLERSKAV
jgi:hypothetical protein